MNHLTTYEQLVAEKLQQLPVPDMADAIWARIEEQLDVDMPEDKPGNTHTGGSSLPGFQFPGNIIFYIFLATLVSVIFYLNRPKQLTETSKTPSANTIIIPATDDHSEKKYSSPGKQAEAIYTDKADLPVDPVKEDMLTEKEQSFITNQAVEVKENEMVKKEEAPPLIETIQKKTTTPIQDSIQKKSRGVKGITSNDYRIAPVRKDSL
ncbi:hypothetical protein [Sediminibacterium sp.]|uniref:hypothetical protein n=1 Tax=Sediminibacterium sp. TaxID=1917865 RepID=UPI002600C964|nr:hypothetical protein [Sediminibacterium sp.]MBW0177796.1 hypothetical protein [Sediminibacterium sp.]